MTTSATAITTPLLTHTHTHTHSHTLLSPPQPLPPPKTGADFRGGRFGSCTSPGYIGHPDCKIAFAGDFTATSDGEPYLDLLHHGTYIAGAITGVAPSAKVILMDVYTGAQIYFSTIVNASNWVIANKDAYSICAVSMAFGGSVQYTSACGDFPEATAIAEMRAAGILSAVASGNEAKRTSMPRPACAPKAVSVGATYDEAMGSMPFDACTDSVSMPNKVTCYSNSAPFLSIVAPGDSIETMGREEGGTSMAAAIVAGAMAVLKSAAPDATADQLEAALLIGGTPTKDTRNGLTKPRLDLETSVDLLRTGAALHINDRAQWAARRALSLSVRTLAAPAAGATVCISDTSANEADCCNLQPYFGSLTYNLASDGDGTKTVNIFVRNGASCNDTVVARAQQVISLDTTPPANATVTLANGSLITRTQSVGLELNQGVDLSGVTDMCLQLSSSAKAIRACKWQAFKATNAVVLASFQGRHTARVSLRDAVGNVAVVEGSIVSDRTPPSLKKFKGKALTSSSIALNWLLATDLVTGVADHALVYAVGKVLPLPGCVTNSVAPPVVVVPLVPGNTSTVLTGLAPGTVYSFRLCARDGAGNVTPGKAWRGKTLA